MLEKFASLRSGETSASRRPWPWLPLSQTMVPLEQPANTRLLIGKGVLALPLLPCAALGDPGPSLASAAMSVLGLQL